MMTTKVVANCKTH